MGQTQNEFLHSVNLNAGSAFPYLVLEVVDDQSYPGNPGFQVMHWHEDLQFIYVLEGAIEIKTLHAAARVGGRKRRVYQSECCAFGGETGSLPLQKFSVSGLLSEVLLWKSRKRVCRAHCGKTEPAAVPIYERTSPASGNTVCPESTRGSEAGGVRTLSL